MGRKNFNFEKFPLKKCHVYKKGRLFGDFQWELGTPCFIVKKFFSKVVKNDHFCSLSQKKICVLKNKKMSNNVIYQP